MDIKTDTKGLVHIVWNSIIYVEYIHQLDEKSWSRPVKFPIQHLALGSHPLNIAFDLQDQAHLVWATKEDDNDVYHLIIPK